MSVVQKAEHQYFVPAYGSTVSSIPMEETIPQFGSLEKLQGQGRTPLFDFLDSFKCKSPLFPNDFGTVIKMSSDQTIGEAFRKMIQCQVISVPVLDPKTKKPVYVLSMMHIMEYLLNNYKFEDFKGSLWAKIKGHFGKSHPEDFMNTPLSQLERGYSLDPAHVIQEDVSLAEACRLMVSSGAHRVLVVNNSGDLVNVITQSRIIQFISNMVDGISRCDETIKDLQLGLKNVICVLNTQTAYEAFKIMKERKITGVAVVDSKGSLLGNISISDLKILGYNLNYWQLIGKTVSEYMEAIRSKPDSKIRSNVFALLEDTNSRYPLIVRCRPHHTLGFVIRMVSYYRVHRLYLVDDTGAPIGIITLSDILKELCQNAI